jgi:cyanate permease
MLFSLALGSALGGAHLHALLVIQAIYGVVSALSLLVALAVSERPVIAGDVTGVLGLTTVWRDRCIRRLAAIAFIGFGFFVALTTWLQTLLKPAQISASTAGWLLVAMVVAGVVGAAILPAPIIRAGRVRRLFQVAAVVTSGACVLFALWKSVPAIGVAIALSGFWMLGCLPVILEIAERRAGSAGISATALIWVSGNAGGIAIALLVQTVVHDPLIAFLLLAAIPVAVLAAVSNSSPLAAEYGEQVA